MIKKKLFYLFLPIVNLGALILMATVVFPLLAKLPSPEGHFLLPEKNAFEIDIASAGIKLDGHEIESDDLFDLLQNNPDKSAIIVVSQETPFSKIAPVLKALNRIGIKRTGYKIIEAP